MALNKLLLMAGGLIGLAPVYRAGATLLGNNPNAARPPGIAVGDLVVVVRSYSLGDSTTTLTTSGGGSWTKAASGTPDQGSDTFYKVLNATDVTNDWVFGSHGGSISLAFTANGARTLTLKDTAVSSTSSTTVTSAGYTFSGGARSMIGVAIDADLTIPTPPVTSTLLGSVLYTSQMVAVAQDPLYRTGAITWTGFATGHAQTLYVFEVT